MAVLIASVLVAGCSSTTGGQAERIEPIPPSPSAGSTTPSTTKPKPTAPPAPGAPIGDVVAWVEAGEPADASQYHSATRDGQTTDLGEDVAFTTPSGKTNCMTDSQNADGALACLVDLVNPPPRPDDAYGEWKGGWVDFDGTNVIVGSVHGDPGRFTAGEGPELPYGQVLSFGDYRCRTDTVGLFCVNYAYQSAVRFSDAGIEPFGCLQPATAPPQTGEKFSC
nr:protein LppI [Mycolicibacterium malmesburyense]